MEKPIEKIDHAMRVNTLKYQAVPLSPVEEDNLFIISTARKSTVNAKNLCPKCQKSISRHEMRTCEACGSEICEHCLRDYEEENHPNSDMED